MIGKVKTVIEDRGFGFLEPQDGGKDLFFHVKDLRQGVPFTKSLQSQTVMYDVVETDKGPAAANVQLL